MKHVYPSQIRITDAPETLRFKRLINPKTDQKYDVSPPKRGTEHAAGWDFYAAGKSFLRMVGDKLQEIPAGNVRAGDLVKYNTGIAMEIPEGHVGLAFARSSICKLPLFLVNSVGVIDSDYRGEMNFIYRILDPIEIERNSYQVGERCGQLVVVKHDKLEFVEVDDLSDTQRGTGGYGSTGKN